MKLKLLTAALAALVLTALPAMAQVPQAFQDTVSNRVTNVPVTPINGIPMRTCPGAATSADCQSLVQPTDSTAIDISTATSTELVSLTAGQSIRVSAWDAMAGGTGNFQLVYGTGTACATGRTAVTGPYSWTTQIGISKGGSLGVLYKLPAGKALCAVTSAAVQMSGSVSWSKF